jgi:hypothetical protein
MARARGTATADDPGMRLLALATSDDDWFRELRPAERTRLAAAEARRAWELHEAGIVRAMHWRSDRRDVVIELEARDEAEARAILDTLPFVAAGGVTFEVIGLRPYDGWTRLFAPTVAAGRLRSGCGTRRSTRTGGRAS